MGPGGRIPLWWKLADFEVLRVREDRLDRLPPDVLEGVLEAAVPVQMWKNADLNTLTSEGYGSRAKKQKCGKKALKKPDGIGQGYEWWLRGDSNPRHTGYEPVALTNWATQPFMVELIGIEPTTSCLQSTRSPS